MKKMGKILVIFDKKVDFESQIKALFDASEFNNFH